MFVILTYDVNAKRVGKVRKACTKYLVRVQNSVFEGTITEAKINRLKKELYNIMDLDSDSVRIYRIENLRYSSIEVVGPVINNDTIV